MFLNIHIFNKFIHHYNELFNIQTLRNNYLNNTKNYYNELFILQLDMNNLR
jgi:hypothetical protein